AKSTCFIVYTDDPWALGLLHILWVAFRITMTLGRRLATCRAWCAHARRQSMIGRRFQNDERRQIPRCRWPAPSAQTARNRHAARTDGFGSPDTPVVPAGIAAPNGKRGLAFRPTDLGNQRLRCRTRHISRNRA